MRRAGRVLAALGLVLAAPAGAGCTGPPAAMLATTDGADGQARIAVGLPDRARPFVLDTGAPVSALRESIAAELGLPHQPIALDQISGATGRPFQERVTVPAVTLGGLTLHDVPFLILPRSHAADATMAGLIGADLFAAYDLELDFARHRLAFWPAGSCRPPDMASLPIEVGRSEHVTVPLALDGAAMDGLIDTGAAQSLLRLDAAHRLFGLDAPSGRTPQIGEVLGADGGRIPAYGYPFATLTLGAVRLAHPVILLIPDETRRVHHPLVGADGQLHIPEDGLPDFILGMPALRQLHLIIAYRERRLYVAAVPPGAP